MPVLPDLPIHIPPAPLLQGGELMDVTPTQPVAGTTEEQIGGGPSPYRLWPSINLTPNAPKEVHFATQNRRNAYPADGSTSVITALPDGLDGLGEEVLKSMCTDGDIKLTPSSQASSQPIHRPPQPYPVSSPIDPFLVPTTQPHKGKAKEQLLHILGLSPPGQLNLHLTPPPSPPSPSLPSPQSRNPLHKVTREPNNGRSSIDNATDNDENQPSPRGQISNLHHKLLHGAYEQADKIFRQASKETNQPLKGIIANYTQKHGQSSRKSDWNVYQQFFASDPDRERSRMGDPDASGG
jgi:hypothetical protein